MATTDATGSFWREMAELEQQLKEAGKQLLHPPDSVDELLSVLDQVEKLLTKVDQSPKKSMQDALKPSMKALIQDTLSKHSDVDVKVAVASCISEITRITAPDAPYDDDQMRDVFRLIVSSFEDLADQSSRSFNKRASILETVSKVRSCVIMLDLECDELIVEMFEHFFKSVREYHLDSIFPSMENIMVLVLEESEEITVDMLKPILASVKRDSKGVPQVARKLGEGVLLKSAAKLKPYLMPALKSMGHSLDNYTRIVASVCEGTTATYEHDDENATGPKPANESKLEKESVDEALQGDESKLTTASSDHKDQVVKEGDAPEDVDPTLDRSPKSVMSNGVNLKVNEDASVDQESSKKPEEDVNQQNVGKEDTDDSDADKLVKTESKPEEEISKKKGKKAADAVINSSDSSYVEGEKEEADKPPSETEKDNTNNNIDAKDPSDEAVIPSETEKVSDIQVSSPKAIESEPEKVSSPSHSGSLPDESCAKNAVASSKKKQDEIASPSKSGNPPSDEKTPLKKSGQPKNKGLTQEDAPEVESDLDRKPQKRAGKKAKEVKEVKPKDDSENGEATSDSDAKPLKKSGSMSTKQSGKKSKQSGKKTVASEPAAKKLKQSAKKVDAKEEESDSDGKPLTLSVKKGEKSKAIVEEEEDSDSDKKPLKLSAKKTNSKKKDDGKKRAIGKNVTEKDQAKSLSTDDEMDSSPKKSGKGEGNSKETTPVTSAKRKRATGKDKVSNTIKYDESLIGTKVKVWWPEDKTYYEGVVAEFYPAKMKHRVSYVDGDEETLNLKKQKWEILQEFTVRDDEEQTAQSEGSPETHKKKKSKTDLASSASQQKTKDSVKRVGGVSSSAKAKGSASKDGKSKDNSGAKSTTQKSSGKTSDAAAVSKESGKSKEDEETPKAGSKTKTVNKSKGKTPQGGSKSNSNGPTKAKSGSSNVKEAESVKTPESGKGKSTENTKTGSKKRKKRS